MTIALTVGPTATMLGTNTPVPPAKTKPLATKTMPHVKTPWVTAKPTNPPTLDSEGGVFPPPLLLDSRLATTRTPPPCPQLPQQTPAPPAISYKRHHQPTTLHPPSTFKCPMATTSSQLAQPTLIGPTFPIPQPKPTYYQNSTLIP